MPGSVLVLPPIRAACALAANIGRTDRLRNRRRAVCHPGGLRKRGSSVAVHHVTGVELQFERAKAERCTSTSRARKPKYARAVYAHSGKRALYILRALLWDTRCCADTDAFKALLWVVCGRPRVNRLWPVTTMQSWHRQDAGRMALERLSQKMDVIERMHCPVRSSACRAVPCGCAVDKRSESEHTCRIVMRKLYTITLAGCYQKQLSYAGNNVQGYVF